MIYDNNYKNLLEKVLQGHLKENRTGTKAYTVFGETLEVDLNDGFPLLTTKKIHWKSVLHELIWFINGMTNVKYLRDNKVKIWDEWSPDDGELGPIYGKQWRSFKSFEFNNSYFFEKENYKSQYDINPNKDLCLGNYDKDEDDDIFIPIWNKLTDPTYAGKVHVSQHYLKSNFIHKDWLIYSYFKNDVKKIDNWLLKKEFGDYTLHTKFSLKDFTYFSKDNCIWSTKEQVDLNNSIKDDQLFLRLDDQLRTCIAKLKHVPNDRRIAMSSWAPGELSKMALPPCHNYCQFVVIDGVLNCSFHMRSTDVFLGLPFDIASYATLTYIISHLTGLKPGKVKWFGSDVHIYENHIDQVKEQLSREHLGSYPSLKICNSLNHIDRVIYDQFELNNYKSLPSIKAKVAV